MRIADAPAPVDHNEAALAATFLDEQVHRDLRRIVGLIRLLEVVERATREHHADDRLAIPGARHTAERAVGVRAAADQCAVADAAGTLAERAARGRGGGDGTVPIERRRSDGSAGPGRRRLVRWPVEPLGEA